MRFTYNGSEHSLSFKRTTADVTRFNGEVVKSRHPFTFVALETVVRDPDGKVTSRTKVLEDKAITSKGDHFSIEQGRLAALRNLTRTMTTQKDLKKAIWTAYVKRARG